MKITGGRVVTIESFHVTRTYGGMLEGVPTRDLNERLVREGAPRLVEKMWGPGRRLHVVPPKVLPVDLPLDARGRVRGEPERLPEYECYAWLTSKEISDEAHGSHAFLVFWLEEATLSIDELVGGVLRGLKWEEIAEDYYV